MRGVRRVLVAVLAERGEVLVDIPYLSLPFSFPLSFYIVLPQLLLLLVVVEDEGTPAVLCVARDARVGQRVLQRA